MINFWLIYSTFKMLRIIKQNSRSSLFREEFCKIVFAYWSFVLSYAGWFAFYIVEFSFEFNKVVDEGKQSDYYQD